MVKKYQKYLIDSGMEGGSINKRINLLTTLINDYIHEQVDTVPEVSVKPVKASTVKPDESKRVELTDEEISKLKNFVCKNERAEQSRNIFLLQLECGQRISDTWKILHGEGIENETEKRIVFRAKKNDNKSYIIKTKEFDRLRKWFDEHPIEGEYDTFRVLTNRRLKKMAEELGLDRIIRYKDTKNKWHSDKLCDIIATHFSRHTFVTKMAREYGADAVAYMVGDKPQTVKDNYYHPKDEDIFAEIDKAKATPMPTQAVSNKSEYIESEIKDLKNALVMVGVPYEDLDGKDLTELWRMMVNKENDLLKLGVDPRRVKEIHKIEDKNLKEKKAILQDVIEKAKVNKC